MSCKRKTQLWESNIDGSLMKTTTQIMLEQGSQPQRTLCTTDHKLVNFQSFNMDDPRYGHVDYEEQSEPPLRSSYMREYTQPFLPRCKVLEPKGGTPDFMFNRLPKNDFDPQTGTLYKFLDDHMHDVPEVRKKVNFFRQLRNQSFLLY
ncbi:uncharacterized protein LOC6567171 [Drosophila grimshawi]|uniref:uncharacterized protein LOC6567171 n=1 Tax=Drosophila grimshawi TaxID=7222 RepID=UPI000C8710AF|nr:uncharacterized protein LOC6567171 [Drosophila grimshawi]